MQLHLGQNNSYVGAKSSEGGNFGMIPCRTDGNVAGYVDKDGQGCVTTVLGELIRKQEFEVLVGVGFNWIFRTNSMEKPSNAIKFGTDGTGPIYIGRCNLDNWGYMGKITDNFYFNKNGNEVHECVEHQILTC